MCTSDIFKAFLCFAAFLIEDQLVDILESNRREISPMFPPADPGFEQMASDAAGGTFKWVSVI